MASLKCSCCDATVTGKDIYEAIEKAGDAGWIPEAILPNGEHVDEVCAECLEENPGWVGEDVIYTKETK